MTSRVGTTGGKGVGEAVEGEGGPTAMGEDPIWVLNTWCPIQRMGYVRKHTPEACANLLTNATQMNSIKRKKHCTAFFPSCNASLPPKGCISRVEKGVRVVRSNHRTLFTRGLHPLILSAVGMA